VQPAKIHFCGAKRSSNTLALAAPNEKPDLSALFDNESTYLSKQVLQSTATLRSNRKHRTALFLSLAPPPLFSLLARKDGATRS